MGRADCLFCSPHRSLEPRRPARERARGGQPVLCEALGCLWWCVRPASIFFGCVYIGKCGLHLYLWCNPDQEIEWLDWRSLRHSVGEALIGAILVLVCAGCCCVPEPR